MSDEFDQIADAPFDEALSQRYLVYALSTITARSLPDVRDGLKPVHRRLLWAMRLLRLDPAAATRNAPASSATRSANITRTAMCRSMTPWSARPDLFAALPARRRQGNFGNIDGDNAAPTATPRRA
jgi:topoisomerase-4 subunit A